ncbi:MAG: hypothetical protein U0931_11770 [Vulcanimicrobiota bacterium]
MIAAGVTGGLGLLGFVTGLGNGVASSLQGIGESLKRPENLEKQAAELKQRSDLEHEMASHLKQWNVLLNSPKP